MAEKYGITFNESKSIIKVSEIPVCGYLISHNQKKPDPARFKALIELPAPHDLASQKRIVGMFAYYSKWIQKFSDKIRPLNHNTKFPMPQEAVDAFNQLKEDLVNACVHTIRPDIPMIV